MGSFKVLLLGLIRKYLLLFLPIASCKIYNLTSFAPTGITQFKPLASGTHFVSANQSAGGPPYSIIYTDL